MLRAPRRCCPALSPAGLLVLLVACGTDPAPPPVPDVVIVAPDASDPSGAAWRNIPMKRVGNPTHVGAATLGFVDATEAAGLPLSTTSHVNFVDFDDDGWPDITLVGDRGLAFFRNVGGRFEDITSALVGPWEDGRFASVTAWADVDGDGDLDLYVGLRGRQDMLLIRDDAGHLIPEGGRGLPVAPDVQAVSFADVDSDGVLDVYVCEGRKTEFAPVFPPEDPGFEGTANHLLLNDGDGRFQDVTQAWNASGGETSETFGAVFFDYDRDGDQDAIVIRDFLSEHLLRNDGGAGFTETGDTVISGMDTSFMGIAVGDVDGDGGLDFYATDFGPDWLYRGQADGTFVNRFDDWLQGADPTGPPVAWGVVLLDADNDGDQDVLNVAAYDKPGAQFEDSPGQVGGYVVLENLGGGALTDVTEDAGLGGVVHGFSLATADFDLDGDPDAVVGLENVPQVSFGPPGDSVPSGARLLRNDSARGAGNRFLEVSLRDPGAHNARAVGAIIDVSAGGRRTSRVVTSGDSHRASHSFVQHFGLGAASRADVTVTWPDGRSTRAHGVAPGYARIAPHEGDCCWADAACDEPWVTCPVWIPPGDPCGGRPCDLCGLVCARLHDCGVVETALTCEAECARAAPAQQEAACVLQAACADMGACVVDRDRSRR